MPVAAAVHALHDFDCDSIVEALVREHLTKKQYNSTLAAFQQEQPPLQRPINKRSVLQDILGLTAPLTDGIPSSAPRQKPSTLELLVQQLLQDRTASTQPGTSKCSSNSNLSSTSSLRDRLGSLTGNSTNSSELGCRAQGSAQASTIAGKQQPAGQQGSTQQEHIQQLQQQTWQRRLPAMSQQQQQPQHQSADIPPKRPLVSPLPCNLQPKTTSSSSSTAHGAGSCFGSTTASPAGVTEQLEELVICDVYFDEPEPATTAPTALPATTTAAITARSGFTAAVKPPNFQPLAPEQQRQLVQLVWREPVVQPEAAWQQGLIWSDVPGLEWGLVQLSGGPCGVLAAVQAHLVGTLMEQQLWHSATPCTLTSSTDSSGSSGWAPSKAQQPAGAAGAAPAVPSAAQLTAEQLQEALLHSLTLILWACATSSRPAHVVMLPQSGGSSAGLRGLCTVGQVLRMVQVAAANTKQELEALVRAALPQWCQRKGWGLLLLVYSALLSRSCEGARSDMDNEVRLVDSLGYCSMELVNLLLTGAAVSNVFDGCRRFGDATQAAAGAAAAGGLTEAAAAAGGVTEAAAAGGVTAAGSDELVIRGVEQRGRVGLLTLFEWYRYVEVGQNLKSPTLPVWVVCSESHFSVLALSHVPGASSGSSSSTARQQQADTAALKLSASSPLLLQYYDGLAKQEGPIVLKLRPAKAGQGWSSRLEGVSEERGVWQGRPIPPLECVVETKWPDAAVSWHGSEPIL